VLAAELLLGLLIAVAVLVTISRRVHVPYPIVLLIGGFALGLVPGRPTVDVEGDVVLIVFVPPIVYVAAFFTSIRSLRSDLPAVASLAVGLVLASAAAVAVVAHALVPGLGWPLAIALGAIVAPPDEVAATSVFERLQVPRRLTAILAGEALLNDATALTLYRLALAAALVGTVSVAASIGALVIVAVGGAVIGLAIGWIVLQVRSRIEDTPVEITISLLTPYASYLSAELVGASGVIACVATGLFLGRRSSRFMGSDVRLAARAVWEMVVFLLNGAIFILIGLQISALADHMDRRTVLELGAVGLAISLTLIVVRFLWLAAMTLWRRLTSKTRVSFHAGEKLVLAWSGMRGVVSLAAALALPVTLPSGEALPARDAIIVVTFTVILVTLAGQGLTLPLVIRAAHLAADDTLEHEAGHARRGLVDDALKRIEELYETWPGHRPLLDQLRTSYLHRAEHEDQLHEAPGSEAEQELVEHRQIRRSVIDAERQALALMRDRGAIDDGVFREIERDLDLEEVRMDA
jgi:CPA1 family monovalent cation:H+ antiporter